MGSSASSASRLATVGCDNSVKIWRLENDSWSQEPPPLPVAHSDWVRAVAWRPDDVRVLASGSWDKTVIVWEQEREGEGPWKQVCKLSLPSKVEVLSWSETGAVLAVSMEDGEVTLFKESNNREYVKVATVDEAGLQDVPNALVSGLAAPQATEPKVSLETISP